MAYWEFSKRGPARETRFTDMNGSISSHVAKKRWMGPKFAIVGISIRSVDMLFKLAVLTTEKTWSSLFNCLQPVIFNQKCEHASRMFITVALVRNRTYRHGYSVLWIQRRHIQKELLWGSCLNNSAIATFISREWDEMSWSAPTTFVCLRESCLEWYFAYTEIWAVYWKAAWVYLSLIW